MPLAQKVSISLPTEESSSPKLNINIYISWKNMETSDKAVQKLVFEPYVEIKRGAEVQQPTSSNSRKCLQRPSKSCCVIIGYVAFISILVGVFAAYEGKY